MTYRFRLRWRLEHGRSLDGLDQPLTVNLGPEMGECKLKLIGGETHLGGQDLALESGAFTSAAAAEDAGEKVLAGLLLASARLGFGLMIHARVPGGGVTRYGKGVLAGGQFDTIYDDSYGLTAYEELGRTAFVKVGDVRVRVSGSATRFVDEWTLAVADAVAWDERILICYDLYASARFESSSRARFLLLIMAIESLVEQSKRSEVELAVIDRLLDEIAKAGLPEEQSKALLNGVGMLKRVSIGHACRAYLTQSIAAGIVTDPAAADHFAACYRVRSQIVHGGETPSATLLADHSRRLEKTVRELLAASIERRAV